MKAKWNELKIMQALVGMTDNQVEHHTRRFWAKVKNGEITDDGHPTQPDN